MYFVINVDRRRDLGDRIGVFRVAQGDKTRGLSTQRGDEIHDYSPKANAKTKQD